MNRFLFMLSLIVALVEVAAGQQSAPTPATMKVSVDVAGIDAAELAVEGYWAL